jgi:putative flippase GtrA
MKKEEKTKKEVCRYMAVTPVIFAIDLGGYYLFNHFFPYSAAKGISYAIANLIGYVINKYWTFECKKKNYGEAGSYFLVQLFLLGFNIWSHHMLRMIWPSAVLRAVVAASLSTALLSFILKKFLVFKTKN